ncbi:MAG: histidine--tRNA ligase [Selenomonadaceae bacterium]|nr:histidine--tRNA ligase [Selenomonadaceae bacterium]
MLTNAPRGTKDILPDSVGNWIYVEGKIRDICARYGYREIRTPVFEHTELFQRGIGEGTDVVDKEMYTFQDRGERSITLRPENTAAAVRAYLQNKMYADGSLTKLFYMGSMFRYDRPQAGRMREFHQFGIEALGEGNPAVDAEVILLAASFLKSLGLNDLRLSLNSVGCPKCRPEYRKALQDFFRERTDQLCKDCRDRLERNPLRILDCKVDADKDFMAEAPSITECLCEECKTHFDEVQRYLREAGVEFELDSRLVRGLDYYTKTAFEIKYAPLGAQSAVAGGGRYDGLVEEIGGASTPAVGFAVGLERVMLALEKQDLLPERKPAADIFVVALGEEARVPGFRLLQKLREAGLCADMDYSGRSMKAQMKQANRSGARFAAILGEDEIKESVVMLKDMEKSEQQKMAIDEMMEKLVTEVKG